MLIIIIIVILMQGLLSTTVAIIIIPIIIIILIIPIMLRSLLSSRRDHKVEKTGDYELCFNNYFSVLEEKKVNIFYREDILQRWLL